MDAAKNSAILQRIKFDLFKSQDPENGRFDVTFELGGKLLYAHRQMLNLVSDTFDSMLSERWTSKDEPIKIEDYTFDEFYQFITFLYSGECQLTTESIFSMVDISEFYDVKCFKNCCDEFLSKMEMTEENIFQFLELADKYSLDQLNASVKTFVATNFKKILNSEAMLTTKKSVIENVVATFKDKSKPEDLFRLVYKWAEKQAMDKGSNTNDAIKSEITSFLPYLQFTRMKLSFLHKFVVPRGFIFGSFDDLSKVLCSWKQEYKVKVSNSIGQRLSGILSSDKSAVVDNIKSLKLFTSDTDSFTVCFWEPIFRIPSGLSSIKAREEIEWYLIYFLSGQIGVVHRTKLRPDLYLLAEMKAENEFSVTPNSKIEVCKSF